MPRSRIWWRGMVWWSVTWCLSNLLWSKLLKTYPASQVRSENRIRAKIRIRCDIKRWNRRELSGLDLFLCFVIMVVLMVILRVMWFDGVHVRKPVFPNSTRRGAKPANQQPKAEYRGSLKCMTRMKSFSHLSISYCACSMQSQSNPIPSKIQWSSKSLKSQWHKSKKTAAFVHDLRQ